MSTKAAAIEIPLDRAAFAFMNPISVAKVDKYRGYLRKGRKAPPVKAYRRIVDANDVERGDLEFLSGRAADESDIGQPVFYISDGYHRALAALQEGHRTIAAIGSSPRESLAGLASGRVGGLKAKLHALRPAIAKAAQAVVDVWEQDEDGMDDELGAGGVCGRVSEAISGVVYEKLRGVETTDGGQDGDDHAFPIVYDDKEAFAVDIPPGVYETGGGYRWKKRKGARITADDVVIESVRRSDVVDSDGYARGRASSGKPHAHAFLPLSTVKVYEAEARRRGVSKVARSATGFLAAYKRAGGVPERLSEAWIRKREGFIARHMAEAGKNLESFALGKRLTRRHLALIMWAYSPRAKAAR